MDLRSGTLFWPAIDGVPPPAASLERDVECDVAILGAGVTGALVADRLSRDGHRVVVLDRRPMICSGSTPASTGLLQYEIDTQLIDLVRKVGRDHAQRAYRASYRSIADFQALVAGLDDDCALSPRGALYLATAPGDMADLAAERDARTAIDIPVELLTAADLRARWGIDRPGALWSAAALEVDPYRLTLALLRRAVGHDAAIFAQTEVVAYEPTGDRVRLTTAAGRRVSASRVVFATGYETPELIDRDLCQLKSTYALASHPVANLGQWRDRCLIWECSRPYLYARTTMDGRVIVGGEDEDFADADRRDALIDSKAATLREKFAALFPTIDVRPQYRWAGTFAQTRDGLPYIGSIPTFPRGHFALGYGGNGITFSLIAAGLIADAIAQRPNNDAELFRFGR